MTDPVALAGLLKDYGPWGLVAVLMFVCAFLFRGWQTCFESLVKAGERNAVALDSSSKTSATVAAALSDRQGDFERAIDLVTASDQRVTANQSTILARVEEILRAIENQRRPRS